MVALTAPGRVMPIPTAPAAWSPAPATIGVPSERPVSADASRETLAQISGDSNTDGRIAGGMPAASRTSLDQRRFATFSISVPDASATSIAYSPDSISRT
jgi:hypothetical protein